MKMTDQGQNCFNQMPKEDKAPHIGAKKSRERCDNKSRERRDNDPDAPGRPLPVFMWFCKDERAKVTALNPKATAPEVAKELGRKDGKHVRNILKINTEPYPSKTARYEKDMDAFNGGGVKGKWLLRSR